VVAIEAEIAVRDSLGRAFVERLDEKGKIQSIRGAFEIRDLLNDRKVKESLPVYGIP